MRQNPSSSRQPASPGSRPPLSPTSPPTAAINSPPWVRRGAAGTSAPHPTLQDLPNYTPSVPATNTLLVNHFQGHQTPSAQPLPGYPDSTWSINPYSVPASVRPNPPALAPGEEMFSIGPHDYVRSLSDRRATLYRTNPDGTRQQCGKIAKDGLYEITDATNNTPQSKYLNADDKWCRVVLDDNLGTYKLLPEVGSPVLRDVYIEASGQTSWIPMLDLPNIGEVIHYARLSKRQSDTHPMTLDSLSILEQDKSVYRLVRTYARQIIGFSDPTIMSAPVRQRDKMIDASIWKHGYPYRYLLGVFKGTSEHGRIPVGAPYFDPFQGIHSFKCSEGGSFNIDALKKSSLFIPETRVRTDVEISVFNQWQQLDRRQTANNLQRGQLNEKMYELMIKDGGYVVLEGGKYANGQNGFDLVFHGTDDITYLMEVKHITGESPTSSGKVQLSITPYPYQLSDGWIDHVLSHPEALNTPAGQAVRDAKSRGRLVQLVGATNQNGEMLMFKADMSEAGG
ncbi:hypothetical protein [Pseudomonas sp. TAE6080]|uniref:hypothetical protein n=1 Tax=Pseudomonas sp. TAE6080 TaxID=2840374 RepID=UPI001C000029|nr:hypothetical protein [Pseudomonas sp. TAE6080]MBT9300286.1 hypothetical protein [Pseudomonas sp. TAE6080]